MTATDSVRLAGWLAAHGPLDGHIALVVALELCADISALVPGRLAQVIGSIDTANLARNPRGQWRWHPTPTATLDRRPSDAEAAERVGAVLFACLTAQPLAEYLPDVALVRTRLREIRPDLPPAIVDVAARLASARSGGGMTLDAVAADLRRALGVDHAPTGWSRMAGWGVATVLVAVVAGAVVARQASRPTETIEPHGLTRPETIAVDAALEGAEFLAMSGEFIAAFSLLDEARAAWRRRVASDDPRLGVLAVRQAWARVARGDVLTAEQNLAAVVAPLERGLGPAHPYVRGARLVLAGLLQRRGAGALADEQRASADLATRALVPEGLREGLSGVAGPPAPGVLAHHAPNAPEREGFRVRDDGAYFAPVTAVARWLAGRDGWRLHVTATGECRVAVDAGRDPHRLQVTVRQVDGAWEAVVEGVQPPIRMRSGSDGEGRLAVRVDVTGDGAVRTLVPGGEPALARVDAAAVSEPPYGLALSSASACALVWWEVAPRPDPVPGS